MPKCSNWILSRLEIFSRGLGKACTSCALSPKAFFTRASTSSSCILHKIWKFELSAWYYYISNCYCHPESAAVYALQLGAFAMTYSWANIDDYHLKSVSRVFMLATAIKKLLLQKSFVDSSCFKCFLNQQPLERYSDQTCAWRCLNQVEIEDLSADPLSKGNPS